MRPKQIQELANTLCHMAAGWRLYADIARLEALGGGVIKIDVHTGA